MSFSLRAVPFPAELEIPKLEEKEKQLLEQLQSPSSLIVRGPAGSGKTILALAAMELLHRHHKQIIGIAPSRARAEYLNTARASRKLPISRPFITPTALAFQVLTDFASARREQLPEPVLLTGSQEDARIQELLKQVDAPWPEYITPEVRQTDYFCSEMRALFATCAHWGISAQRLDELGSELAVAEWQAAAVLLSQYEPSYKDNSWDAARMQDRAGQVLNGWERDAALLSPPQLPDWVVVDDLQDCPASTVRLLTEMGKRGTKVFALYNPEVAVETFRGGYPHGGSYLAEQLKCPLVTLEESFRETSGGLQLLDPLNAKADCDSKREQKYAEFSTVSSQARAIAEYLRYQHLIRQVSWADMAVIARNRSQLDEIVSLLRGLEIPVNERQRPILFKANHVTGAILSLFTLPGQSELAKQWSKDNPTPSSSEEISWSTSQYLLDDKLVSPRGKAIRHLLRSPLFALDSLQMLRLERTLVGADIAVEAKIEDFYSTIGTPRFPLTQVEMVEGGQIFILCHQVLTAALSKLEEPPLVVLEKIWDLLNLEDSWCQRALSGDEFADQALDAVIALVRHAEIWSQRHLNADMRAYCQVLLRQTQAEDVLTGTHGIGAAVALETVFSAAGRTWDTCAIIGMQDGQWPAISERGSLLRSGEISDLLHATALLSPTGKLQFAPGESRSRALERERCLARSALSRARSKMLVTVRSDAEENPSIFFDNLHARLETSNFSVAQYLGSDWDQQLGAGGNLQTENRGDHQLFPSLRSLVGHLRGVLASNTDGETRQKAVETLAFLASKGARFANPDTWRQVGIDSDWWTNPAGLKSTGSRAVISPSALENLNECEFRWLLSRRGGEKVEATGHAAWGTLVHQIAEEMTDSSLSERLAFFYAHWPQETEAFFSRQDGKKREEMVRRLSRYLDDHKMPAVTEISSYAVVSDAAMVAARLDRLEAGEDGIRIVDFKTGKTVPSEKELAEHLQLACYQLVLEAALLGGDSRSRQMLAPVLARSPEQIQSASLIYLSKHKRKTRGETDYEEIAKEMVQSPLTDEQKGLLLDSIIQAAKVVSGSVFRAVENPRCDRCSLRSSCPLKAEGEQVL